MPTVRHRAGGRPKAGLTTSLAMILLTGALGAGCAGLSFGNSEPDQTACVDDSHECIGRRQAELKSLMADRQRKWVREPATPHAYASGVRMFAFRGSRRMLSCDELAIGRREADQAPHILRGPSAQSLSPAQVSRGVMLATEVSRELASEMKRRCRA